jgi:hypothetical protein
MAFNAISRVSPSFVEPKILTRYNQRSGAFAALGTGGPQVKLGSEDLVVYQLTLDMRAQVSHGQTPYQAVNGPSFISNQIQANTYIVRSRANFDHHDTANAAGWNISLIDANRKAMRAGIASFARSALLYGVAPSQGEGLLNAQGATALTFPADENGKVSITGMDPAYQAQEVLTLISELQSRINAVAQGALRIVVLAPQRVVNTWKMQIVPLMSYQRAGGGTNSVTGTIDAVAAENDVDVFFAVDDTLLGKGQGGSDMVVIVAPELVNPQSGPGPEAMNTNEFATLASFADDATAQYFDKAAPSEIVSPLAGGATDQLLELRLTAGWVKRPEALTLLSVPYTEPA